MIVFDLVCGTGGHVFEAWFGSTGDYEAQKARGLVSCPLCGAADIDKAPMSPRLGQRGNRQPDPVPASPPAPAQTMTNHPPAAVKVLLQAMAQHQAKMLETSDYVGDRFVDEARAIHLGESDARAIHGQATPDQARALIDEGIEVAPLPFPVRPPGMDN